MEHIFQALMIVDVYGMAPRFLADLLWAWLWVRLCLHSSTCISQGMTNLPFVLTLT